MKRAGAGAGIAAILAAAAMWAIAFRGHPPLEPAAAVRWEQAKAWLNSSEPVNSEQLRGRVVLVFFWSYSNSTALDVLPVVMAWEKHYGDRGLEIIGVHTPEFSFEESPERVAEAVQRLGIHFPVAVDSDRAIWKAFSNHEWPAYYVINAQGEVTGFQIGAGREMEIEQYLRTLLQAGGFTVPETDAILTSVSSLSRTPEILFREIPAERFMVDVDPVMDQPRVYKLPQEMPLHAFGLGGVWQFEEERVRSIDPKGLFAVRYLSAQCCLVMDGPAGAVVQFRLDGKPIPPAQAGRDVQNSSDQSRLVMAGPRLYQVVSIPGGVQEHTLEATCPKDVVIYACTFS
ncbi:MAG: redoxin domain-containing protein [Candidatus Omnitrophica bacterium]|nr:redoxin domain-containing protein [Candidatus Omnitrophota bacterium]